MFEAEEIQAGFIDNEGTLWITTNRNGIFQIRKSDFLNVTSEHIPSFENIYSVVQSNDGSIWAGSFFNGIYRITGESVTNWNTANSNLNSNLCRFLFEDSDGTIYAGMWDEGLWRYDHSGWTLISEIQDLTVPNSTVEAMYRDNRGRLFVGSRDQLIVQENGKFKLFDHSNSNGFRSVRVIRENDDETLFLDTIGNGLTIIKDENAVNYTTMNSNLTSNSIRDIFVQSTDTIWAATENLGLNRVVLDDTDKIVSFVSVSERDGLIKNSLHRIIETADGHFWLSSNGGIMRVSKHELNRYANGETNQLSVLGFDEKDGMINREANGGVPNAGILSSDGKLWFPNQ